MGLGTGRNCSNQEAISLANEYLGTSYDTVKAVYDHLEKISLVADLGELNRGFQGNVPNVTKNGDGSYTIFGHNGNITIKDGVSPTVHPNVYGNGVVITDANGVETTLNNGLRSITFFIYRVSNVDLVTPPTGGSYDGSTLVPPTDYQTTPFQPFGDNKLYMSTTVFTEQADGTFTHSGWTIPVRMSGNDGETPQKGTDYFDGESGAYISYIYAVNAQEPLRPIGGSYTGDPNTEIIPVGWTDNPPIATGGDVIWVSMTRYTKNQFGNWESSIWSLPRRFTGREGKTPQKGVDYVDGTTGAYHSFVYQNASNPPTPPSDGSYNGVTEVIPTGWTDSQFTPPSGQSTWISKATYRDVGNNTWVRSAWSAPARVSGYTPVRGIDYTDGTDGSYLSSIYYTGSQVPLRPSGGSYNGTSEIYPTNWTDDPVAPANSSEHVYLSKRRYKNDGLGNWSAVGAWSLPIKVSGENGYTPQFGVDYFNGLEGTFISYIFKNAPSAPVNPIGGAFDGTDETFPTGWSDDPVEPTGSDVVWVSKTKYIKGTDGNWSNTGWSTPIQFNGRDGTAKFTSQIFLNATETPPRPVGGSYDGTTETYPTGWSDEPQELAEGEATYTSLTTYSKDEQTGDWTNTGWSLPVIFNAAINVDGLLQDIEELEGDIDTIVENLIWNTVEDQSATTHTGVNQARINTSRMLIANETQARVTQADQIIASVDTERGRIDSEILRLDQAYTNIDGTAQALSVVQGQINHADTGLSATYQLAQQAKSTADGNVNSISVLSGQVNNPNSGLTATYQLAQQAKLGADGNAQSITNLSNRVNDDVAELTLAVSNVNDDINNVKARAYLGVNVNNRVTGIHIAGSASQSSLQFQAEQISFVDSTGAGKLTWDNGLNQLKFIGSIDATGSITGGSVSTVVNNLGAKATLIAGTLQFNRNGSDTTLVDHFGVSCQSLTSDWLSTDDIVLKNDLRRASGSSPWIQTATPLYYLSEAITNLHQRIQNLENA